MSSAVGFMRDRFTWLAYAMLGVFAYYQGVPGVAMPLLRDDLNLSYTVGGMHISAMALGSIMIGLLNERLVARWGRRVIFWGGGAGMVTGALLLIVGRHPVMTIAAALVMGLFGAALLITIQATLADHHGARRAIALTESNVAASTSLILPGLLIGGFERVGIGWRGAFVVPALVWLMLAVWGHKETIPASAKPAEDRIDEPDDVKAQAGLPRVFWLYWVALAFGVAVEWSVIAWSADFLVKAGNVQEADASLAMTFFFVAMMIARFAGSRLTRQFDVARLLWSVLGTGLTGVGVFWLSPGVALKLIGLFIAGLGIANLFPFLLSITMNTAPDRSNLVSARLSVGAGMAILTAPQVLGGVADQVGIRSAYGLVVVLFVLVIAAVSVARRGQNQDQG